MTHPAPPTMDLLTAIHTRRSVRRYVAWPVPEPLVEALLRAAMAAPSASNQQPWQFVVVDDRALLDHIALRNPAAFALRTAPLAIVVCGDLRLVLPVACDFWIQDCAAAIQNLLLAAHAHGLGAVWLGGHPLPHLVHLLQGLLGLPSQVIPLAVVAVGYPAERKPTEDRFNPARVHRNRWQGPIPG
jgi:nitroreductase